MYRFVWKLCDIFYEYIVEVKELRRQYSSSEAVEVWDSIKLNEVPISAVVYYVLHNWLVKTAKKSSEFFDIIKLSLIMNEWFGY